MKKTKGEKKQKRYLVIVIIMSSILITTNVEASTGFSLLRFHIEFESEILVKNKQEIKTKEKELYKIGEKILQLYDSVEEAKVCSKANRFNNSLQKEYSNFLKVYSEIKEYREQYKNRYYTLQKKYADFNFLVEHKPFLYSTSAKSKNIAVPSPKSFLKNVSNLRDYKTKISSVSLKSQKIADSFFNEVYYDMLHIGYAEAGCDWFPPEIICYVLNVIENRVESPKFNGQNTVHDVIFAPGQYSPTWEGGFYQEPTEQARERVAQYLKGNFDTGMPSNVLYQALFKQGDGVWKYTEGMYFCYQN